MTKSSEVLRLAAEYEFVKNPAAIHTACVVLGYDYWHGKEYKFRCLTGFGETDKYSEHAVMSLCLAAAIAESEGD